MTNERGIIIDENGEDWFGDFVDFDQEYICDRCWWVGTVNDMMSDADCNDPYDAIYSDYCCPNCDLFVIFLSNWKKYE